MGQEIQCIVSRVYIKWELKETPHSCAQRRSPQAELAHRPDRLTSTSIPSLSRPYPSFCARSGLDARASPDLAGGPLAHPFRSPSMQCVVSGPKTAARCLHERQTRKLECIEEGHRKPPPAIGCQEDFCNNKTAKMQRGQRRVWRLSRCLSGRAEQV